MPGLPMARHEKVSPKRWRILAFADAIWFRHLPLTNRDPELLKRPSPPWFLQKSFITWLFSGKNQTKSRLFSLVNARICQNNVEMFLLAGKNLETFNFISFYLPSLHFDSQSFI